MAPDTATESRAEAEFRNVRANLDDPTPWNVATDMNHPTAPQQKGRLRSIVKTVSFLLLQPALAPGPAAAHTRSRLPAKPNADGTSIREAEPAPYLRVIGTVPLRFGAEPPPPDLTTRPAAGAPPTPVPAPMVAPAINPEIAPVAIAPPPAPKEATTEPPPAPAPAKTNEPTLRILPDDARPAPRPEDFLPFFQFPGNNDNSARSPGPLPPSSATYQQK